MKVKVTIEMELFDDARPDVEAGKLQRWVDDRMSTDLVADWDADKIEVKVEPEPAVR